MLHDSGGRYFAMDVMWIPLEDFKRLHAELAKVRGELAEGRLQYISLVGQTQEALDRAELAETAHVNAAEERDFLRADRDRLSADLSTAQAALVQTNDVLTDSRREHYETVQIAMGIVGNALAQLSAIDQAREGKA